jgi:ferritin-like metal-binding protein YciE
LKSALISFIQRVLDGLSVPSAAWELFYTSSVLTLAKQEDLMSEDRTREIFVTGLKNAHAMENQALSIMKPQLNRIENYPDVAAKLEQHITETEGQIVRLEEILSGLDEDRSALKDIALSFTGSMAAMGHTLAGDEILKNSFANFAFENYEIAAYNSLITLAELGGFPGNVSGLQANLDEEIAMARWLEDNLRPTTVKFANLKEAGETAKI